MRADRPVIAVDEHDFPSDRYVVDGIAGATGRVNLPKEAASFERVRGGARLAAVFKKGSASVCLITGGPARLAAKMVQLEAKPTDLAVSDTSLFATFADGRAALRALVERPYSPDRRLVLTIIDRGPTRALVRQLQEEEKP